MVVEYPIFVSCQKKKCVLAPKQMVLTLCFTKSSLCLENGHPTQNSLHHCQASPCIIPCLQRNLWFRLRRWSGVLLHKKLYNNKTSEGMWLRLGGTILAKIPGISYKKGLKKDKHQYIQICSWFKIIMKARLAVSVPAVQETLRKFEISFWRFPKFKHFCSTST